MRTRDILRAARSFRRGMLGKRDSSLMCFVVAAPLHGWLVAAGVDCALEGRDFGHCNHFFIRLADGRILDPTADQFGVEPAVYLGPMPELYEHWIRETERVRTELRFPRRRRSRIQEGRTA